MDYVKWQTLHCCSKSGYSSWISYHVFAEVEDKNGIVENNYLDQCESLSQITKLPKLEDDEKVLFLK